MRKDFSGSCIHNGDVLSGSCTYGGGVFGVGEARISVVDEVFSRREDAAPWSFLALEFFKLSGGVRRFSLL